LEADELRSKYTRLAWLVEPEGMMPTKQVVYLADDRDDGEHLLIQGAVVELSAFPP
jgi:hypothetical protein